MRPIEPFVMPKYKCKNCGKIISEPQLKSFKVSFGDFQCFGQWCLCDECLEGGITKPKCVRTHKWVLGKDDATFLRELADLITKYKVRAIDVFFEEED